MGAIVQYTDWLDEEVGNMARDGLRTLVVARKILTDEQYLDFEVCAVYTTCCLFVDVETCCVLDALQCGSSFDHRQGGTCGPSDRISGTRDGAAVHHRRRGQVAG